MNATDHRCQVRDERQADVAARSQAQPLRVALRLGLAQQAHALLGVSHEGIEQRRIFGFHNVLQGCQDGIVEMDIGQRVTP